MDMEVSQERRDEIVRRAKALLYKTELLIAQCDSWLPAEEGNRNMMKKIMERNKTKIFQVPYPIGYKSFKLGEAGKVSSSKFQVPSWAKPEKFQVPSFKFQVGRSRKT